MKFPRPTWVLLGVAATAIVALSAAFAQRARRANVRLQPGAPPATAPFKMVEVHRQAGLDFRWTLNPKRPLRNLDTFGCGCAFLDFDRDGWLDILLVGEPKCALFRNRGDGTFEDVSARCGLDRYSALWKGCGIGDLDGDGYPEIILSGYRRLLVLQNVGGKSVRDITTTVGLDPRNHENWGSGVGLMDLDGDRDLDLVVLNYVIFNDHTPQLCEITPGVKSGCPPQTYQPEFGRLFRNDGGRFTDVTASSGFRSTHGKALVVAFSDIDDDGKIDFYIGNDGTTAELMRNEGGWRFKNLGEESGAGYGVIPGQPIAAMGADWADYDGDGRLDLAASAFENEAYCVYHNDGQGLFTPVSDALGLTKPTFGPLGFGTTFLDVDNDGHPDLFFANGHVYDNTGDITPGSRFKQPMMLFRNSGGSRMEDAAPLMGETWARPILGRGSARGDYDRDGRVDLLVVDYDGEPLLLHNETANQNHWLTVRARGKGKNRDGYGLRVTAQVPGRRWVGEVSPSASYLSSSAAEVHFGLGQIGELARVQLRWPSGKTQLLKNVRADQILSVEEPP